MKYLCFVLYMCQISYKECTVDINMKELLYIADHLTPDECRLLFASLYFESYELPNILPKAAQHIPKNIPCLQLLVKWNSSAEAWEGKTHSIVEHRLRQLNKIELADMLGKMVFHQLAKDVNKSLEDGPHFEGKPGITSKVFNDSNSKFDVDDWTTLDSILSVMLCGLLFITLAAFCRMLNLTFRRAKVKRKNSKNAEELIDLMSADPIESDQETIYELDMENRKRSRISFEDDIRKIISTGSVK